MRRVLRSSQNVPPVSARSPLPARHKHFEINLRSSGRTSLRHWRCFCNALCGLHPVPKDWPLWARSISLEASLGKPWFQCLSTSKTSCRSLSPCHLRPVTIKPVSRIFKISDSNPIRGKCGCPLSPYKNKGLRRLHRANTRKTRKMRTRKRGKCRKCG